MALPKNTSNRRVAPTWQTADLSFWEKITIFSPIPLKTVGYLLLTAVLLIAAYYFSLFAIHGFSPNFLEINRCIESGGRWNAFEKRCESVPEVYIPPDRGNKNRQ